MNGDKLKDIAIGTSVSGSSGLPGQAKVVSICAAQRYGMNLAPNETLSMFWIHGGPGHESEGGPGISGAASGANGLLAASIGSGLATYFDVPVLLDITPGFLLTFDIVYNESGYIDFPLNLRNPSLSGVTIYTQAFEYNPAASQGIFASNALLLLFSN